MGKRVEVLEDEIWIALTFNLLSGYQRLRHQILIHFRSHLEAQCRLENLVSQHPDAPTISMLTPLDKDVKLWGASGEETEADITKYGKQMGRLSWLAHTTRPDIAYAVAILSQYLTKPLSNHMTQALRCVAYLNTTKHLTLTY
jgi:hypothetical protein